MISKLNRMLILPCVLLFFNCGEPEEKLLVIGHRGAMGHETENSLASVEKALELGVDMIEIDVFRIKSGEVVVFHDKHVDRLTNGGGAIEDYYIFDLKKLQLQGGHSIPMLQDVIKLVAGRASLNIELKGANTAGKVDQIMSYYVEQRGRNWKDFLVSSFNWDELRKMRELNKDVAIAVLTEGDPLEALEVAKELNAVAINPNYKRLTAEVVKKIQEAGFAVYPWTVNEAEAIAQLKEMGVDGIISDYPERLR